MASRFDGQSSDPQFVQTDNKETSKLHVTVPLWGESTASDFAGKATIGISDLFVLQ